MFIIPSGQVLLLGTGVVLVLAALQWFISGRLLRDHRVQKPDGAPGKARSDFNQAA